MIYCFDIDGTICTNTDGDYERALPHLDRLLKVNTLYNSGDTILLHTARGTTTGRDWREVTEQQLEYWGVKYHKLIFGKLEADLFIDDKGVNADVFFGR